MSTAAPRLGVKAAEARVRPLRPQSPGIGCRLRAGSRRPRPESKRAVVRGEIPGCAASSAASRSPAQDAVKPGHGELRRQVPGDRSSDHGTGADACSPPRHGQRARRRRAGDQAAQGHPPPPLPTARTGRRDTGVVPQSAPGPVWPFSRSAPFPPSSSPAGRAARGGRRGAGGACAVASRRQARRVAAGAARGCLGEKGGGRMRSRLLSPFLSPPPSPPRQPPMCGGSNL